MEVYKAALTNWESIVLLFPHSAYVSFCTFRVSGGANIGNGSDRGWG